MRSSGLFMYSQAVWRNFENVLQTISSEWRHNLWRETSVLSAENPVSFVLKDRFTAEGWECIIRLLSVWLLSWGNVGCHSAALVPSSASAVDHCQLGPAQAGKTAVNSENCHILINFSICALKIRSVLAALYLWTTLLVKKCHNILRCSSCSQWFLLDIPLKQA